MDPSRARALRDAVLAICPDIQARVMARGDRSLQENQLWWELSCCVLSSQVPFGLAAAAATRICEAGILSDPSVRENGVLAAELIKLLSDPLPFAGGARRYRFPGSRARQLAQAWAVVEECGGSLPAILDAVGEAIDAREWLVHSVPGLGPKQASMFLRNVGISYDLAVLDRHVLGYMAAIGLCEEAPKAVGSLPAYKRHETTLRIHAEGLGYPVGFVDWAIWIVMRAEGGMKTARVSA